MKSKSIDTALLENALTAIEKVLAHADSQLPDGPCATAALAWDEQEYRFRTSAAQSAVNICLSSAAALVDVSKALMSAPCEGRTPDALAREWQALVAHTTIASRSAHRAALIMAEQKTLPAAQGMDTTQAKASSQAGLCRLAALVD